MKRTLSGSDRLIDRTVDLMEVVSKAGYVHPDFRGSSSIKKVLPVLAPDITYSTLASQDGASPTSNGLPARSAKSVWMNRT